MPTPIWKDKAEELNVKADEQADSLIDKLKTSKWTGVIVIVVAIVFVVAILMVIF